MATEEIIKESAAYLMNTYGRLPVAFVKGRGATLIDADGKEYLDFLAGLAVSSLGHAHPALTAAITAQAGELIHTSNLYHIPNQSKLARYLVDLSFGDRVFFCNSGAEANEGAIKLARRYQEKIANAPDRKVVMSFRNSFHGRTIAALAATGQSKYHDGYAPLPSEFIHADFNDLSSVEAILSSRKDIAAILVEPIQAEGGIIPATQEFLTGLRRLCDAKGLLLIFDEVQTGVGRTGKLFAYEHYDVAPDIMTLAKGLGGGVPIGAIIATEKVAAGFTPGSHASTFGGNPLSTAAAIAVIKVFLNDQIIERAAASGKFLFEKLNEKRPSSVKDVRGKGLLIGIELDRPAREVVDAMRAEGFIIGSAGDNVLRLTPPLIVSQHQCAQVVKALWNVIS